VYRNKNHEKTFREHRSNDRSNVKGFKGFGARFILKVDRNQKWKKTPGGKGAMIGAMSKVSMVSVQELY
jgi:hypothetical protein